MQAQQAIIPMGRWSDRRMNGCQAAELPGQGTNHAERTRRERTAFEIRHTGEKMARGIEIELGGIGDEVVFRAYYLNRFGTPGITRSADLIRVRFESNLRPADRTTLQTTRTQSEMSMPVSRPHLWEFVIIGGGGSERFCLELSTCQVIATYRWLVATDTGSASLIAESTPACRHHAATGDTRILFARE